MANDTEPVHQAGRRIIWGVVGMIILIVAGTALFWPPSEIPPKPWMIQVPLEEVPRSKLILTDQLLYPLDGTNLFTGFMVDFYGDHSLKSRSMVLNGMLHGISEGWYTNRQLAVREHFIRSVSDGLRTKWHLSGSKKSEVEVVDGQLHGTFRRWYENGALSAEVELQQGKPEGTSRAYYASGYLRSEAILKDGKPKQQQFWKDGERVAENERPSIDFPKSKDDRIIVSNLKSP